MLSKSLNRAFSFFLHPHYFSIFISVYIFKGVFAVHVADVITVLKEIYVLVSFPDPPPTTNQMLSSLCAETFGVGFNYNDLLQGYVHNRHEIRTVTTATSGIKYFKMYLDLETYS